MPTLHIETGTDWKLVSAEDYFCKGFVAPEATLRRRSLSRRRAA
jgi:hypothetical protein